MKTLRKMMLAVVGLIISVHLLHGQIAPYGIYNGGPVQSAQPDPSDSIVQLTADAQGLSLVSPDQIPFSGTFWTIVPGSWLGGALPYPCPPPGQLPTYALPGGSFLVDDTATTNTVTQAQLEAQATAVVDLVSQGEATAANAQPHAFARAMDDGAPPSPGGGTGGTNSYSPDDVTNNFVADYGTNLWLEITNISGVWVNLLVSNTMTSVKYEIDATTNLAPAVWNFEGFFYGSLTNWTATSVAAFSSTTNLFLRVKSWQSSDGSGLPDWWELEYFGTLGNNPNALDSAGDGYTIYQKFQMGLNPNVFYTPTAPANFTTSYNLAAGTETITWTPSRGTVTSYTLSVYNATTGQTTNITLSATNTSFTMPLAAGSPDFGDYPYGPQVNTTFGLMSNYGTNGSSIEASPQYAEGDPAPLAELVNGADGRLCYVFQNLPSDLSAVRIYRNNANVWYALDNGNVDGPFAEDDQLQDIYNPPIADGYFEIPAASITNGVCELSDSQIPPYFAYDLWVQTVRSNGVSSAWAPSVPPGWTGAVYFSSKPFVDGRRQLKDNLIFSLRAADYFPFAFTVNEGGDGWYLPSAFTWPNNYVYADFYNSGYYDGGYFSGVAELFPFYQNDFYRNFLFDADNLTTDGFLNTGCSQASTGGLYSYNISITNFPEYYFDAAAFITATNPPVPSSQLTTSLTHWIMPGYASVEALSGGAWAGDTNCYGLPYVSQEIAWVSNSVSYINTYYPGGTEPGGVNGVVYNDVAQPGFQSTGYYFARPTTDPVPDRNDFSPTNTTPLMFAGVGGSLTVAGYNKLAVTNGYSGVYGYLGQYFAGAYQISNGVVTASSAGLVSPLGVFSPTVPGPAALVTMPDLDPPYEQGTCTVYAISLQLDANHDGAMDTSLKGPDSTSPISPYVFWCNNNFDRLEYDSDDSTNYMDDVALDSIGAWGYDGPVPDYDFTYANGQRSISTTRDLEDFSRLWVCGITSNLVAGLPSGSTVTLSWGAVLSPYTSAPTIDLFAAADADGGIGYLTNTATATTQINYSACPYIQRLGPGQSLQLNATTFANHWAGNHFIWCGVTNGAGGLNLTIADSNGNVLAQTTTYIEVQDIKQMYERWTVGDNVSVFPTNAAVLATEGLPTGTPAFQYPQSTSTNTPYILYVHGWNMTSYDKDRFAETAYKRLYWQGYQGRLGVFRWPTGNGFVGLGTVAANPTERDNYDSSEYNAWLSASALLKKLNDLNAIYPGHVYLLGHSMGNVVSGEALRLAGTNKVVNTYVASQAAVSAHTYDENTNDVPDYSFSYPPWSLSADTPNIYGNWFAGNYGGGAGHIFSFYNTNDFALQRSAWQLNQLFKPDQNVLEGLTPWDYNYGGTVNDPAPWNKFSKDNPFFPAESVIFDIVNVLTNRYEVMAYAAQSYTTAFGATPNVANVSGNVYLGRSSNRIWPPDLVHPNHPFDEHFYHSAQFRGDYPAAQGYWIELLGSEAFNLR